MVDEGCLACGGSGFGGGDQLMADVREKVASGLTERERSDHFDPGEAGRNITWTAPTTPISLESLVGVNRYATGFGTGQKQTSR